MAGGWRSEELQRLVADFLDATVLKDDNANYKIFAHSLGNLILAGAIQNNHFFSADNGKGKTCEHMLKNGQCGVPFVSLAA